MIGDSSELQKQKLGDFLYSDNYRTVVADTYEQALEFFKEDDDDFDGELDLGIYAPKAITQEEIDNNEIDDMDAEVGQTWYFTISSKDRPLKEGELRGFSI